MRRRRQVVIAAAIRIILHWDFPSFGSATFTLNFVRYINLI